MDMSIILFVDIFIYKNLKLKLNLDFIKLNLIKIKI